MKNLLKKCFSILAMTSLLTSQIYISGLADDALPQADANGFYPTAAYTTAANELDGSGAWKYRELVPDVSCESENTFKNISSNYTDVSGEDLQTEAERISSDKHTGNYSWYRRGLMYRGIGFTIPANIIEKDVNYISSAWIRSDMEGATEGTEAKTLKVQMFANSGGKQNFVAKPGVELSKEWKKYDIKFQALEGYDEKNVFNLGICNYLTKDDAACNYKTLTRGSTKYPLISIYVDDWSVRREIPADFAKSYIKSTVPAVNKPIIKNDGKVTFTFSLDIDPRTVRKENINVNGAANSENISDVNVITNEATRETKLEITMANLVKNGKYTIALPELKDAWGRDVIGTRTLTVYCADVPDGQYTVFDDLDDGGLWKYRELVPNVDCETADGFAAVGKSDPASSAIQDADIVLSTDKHSGNYSIKRTMRQNPGIGFVVPKEAVVAGDTYIVSAYLKTGIEKNEYEKTISVKINNEEGGFSAATTDDRQSFDVTTDWKFHSTKLKFKTAFTKDTNRVYLMWNNLTLATGGVQDSSVTEEKPVQTLYIDDWSFRKIPAFDVYQTGAYVDNTSGKSSVKFVYDKDIDYRSVDISNVTINGATSDKVESFTVSTDEITRESVLTLNINGTIPQNSVVSVSNIKDAWGRDVKNTFSTGLSLGAAKITAADGTEITEGTALSAGVYTYTISGITNGTDNAADISAILALFDSNKNLVSIAIDSKSFAKGSVGGELCAELTVPENAAGGTLKSFIWNTKNLAPYTNR